jgi:hypothetical protein
MHNGDKQRINIIFSYIFLKVFPAIYTKKKFTHPYTDSTIASFVFTGSTTNKKRG